MIRTYWQLLRKDVNKKNQDLCFSIYVPTVQYVRRKILLPCIRTDYASQILWDPTKARPYVAYHGPEGAICLSRPPPLPIIETVASPPPPPPPLLPSSFPACVFPRFSANLSPRRRLSCTRVWEEGERKLEAVVTAINTSCCVPESAKTKPEERKRGCQFHLDFNLSPSLSLSLSQRVELNTSQIVSFYEVSFSIARWSVLVSFRCWSQWELLLGKDRIFYLQLHLN